ncbi:hypothetical protein FHX83_002616 [Clostridium beijerinckii]|nr:hypothetical protein [Clostridium beijerinckii]
MYTGFFTSLLKYPKELENTGSVIIILFDRLIIVVA